MGLIKKLFKGAAVAGTAVAAVKVADQIKADNPDGVQDLNGDGKVNYKDYAIAAKQAAAETFETAKEVVNEKAEEIKEKANEERASHEGNYQNPYSAKTEDYFPQEEKA